MNKAIHQFVIAASFVAVLFSISYTELIAQENKVDYLSDIQPILEANCYRCHSAQQEHGALRLDQKDLALRGGASGGAILGGPPSRNVLLERILTSDESQRMPFGEPSLSANDIKTIQTWVEQGSPWPDAVSPKLSREQWFERVSDAFQRHKIQGILFIAIMISYLIAARLLPKRRNDSESTTPPSSSSRKLLTNGLLLSLAVLISSIALGEIMTLRSTIAKLKNRINQFEGHRSLMDPGKPIVPIQAKQLQGTYYRGNDERNLQLFNGGFYRTATFHVSLRDRNENLLTYGSKTEGAQLAIHVVIERAPFATQMLFTDKVMATTELAIPDDNPEAKPSKVLFKTIDPGERWGALIPISDSSLDSQSVLKGKVHLRRSISHYELSYNIKIVDGKIGNDSEIRMISLLQTGNLVRRPAGMILENEFSARPIPEITGGNSTDPDALGITEHIKSGLLPANDTPSKDHQPN